ncbi:MAG: hypothetical protein HYY28_14705 [Betaproteobacteria bacterium]|nr:hypothetical protein [Betaproteobacteria bacterium]
MTPEKSRTAVRSAEGRQIAIDYSIVVRLSVVDLIRAYASMPKSRVRDRAKYGARLLEHLAEDLAQRGVRGLDARCLERCRVFYRVYPQLREVIPATVSPELPALAMLGHSTISATLSPESARPRRKSTDSGQGSRNHNAPIPLNAGLIIRFSWSALQELIGIDEPWKRAFLVTPLEGSRALAATGH